MTSFNHYALGSVAHFMHTTIGGLSPLAPGWSRFLVRPQPGGTVTHAKTSFVSGYGRASVAWEIVDGVFKAEVEVPPNTTARVELPGVKAEEVGSGTRRWEVKWDAGYAGEWPPKIVQPPFCKPIKDEFV
jgi:alpha-L-rhamnosidase